MVGKKTHQKKQIKTQKKHMFYLSLLRTAVLAAPETDLDLHTLAGLPVILIVYAIYLRVWIDCLMDLSVPPLHLLVLWSACHLI